MQDSTTRMQWNRVKHDSPCPICDKSDWCSVSADGSLAHCRRTTDGAAEARIDKAGVPYYVHRLNGAMQGPCNGYTHPGHLRRPPASGATVEATAPSAADGKTVERADADTLHRAYTCLVKRLDLSADDLAALRKRGLNEEEIGRRGYRSYPLDRRPIGVLMMLAKSAGFALESVPGFLPKNKERGARLGGDAGLFIPCRDTAGRIVAGKIRRYKSDDGPKYVYLSSTRHGGPGPGAPVHVPLGVEAPAELVRLTEGELKADVATVLSGVPTISAPGVAAWRACLPVLQSLGAKTVRVAFDRDALNNPHVARALVECVEALPGEGFAVELESWPESAGKGIDDALAAGATTDVLAGEAALSTAREIADAAGVHRERPASECFSVEGVGEVTLTVEAARGSKPQRVVCVKVGDKRHVDRIDITSERSRAGFIKRLSEKAAIDRTAIADALDSRLIDLAAEADQSAQSTNPASGEEMPSQATLIARMAASWDLWHTPAGDGYATIPMGEHSEHWPIRSQAFRRFVAKSFYETENTVANGEALGAAINLIEAQAAHDGEEHPVFVRVAEHDGNIYIDLCDRDWRAVEVSPAGWQIVDNPPVRFRRSKGMLALPAPEPGGNVAELRRFINVADEVWPLIVAWLVAALRPRGPYPVLALFATQGAGKSTAARMVRSLVDPNTAPLRAEPRELSDLMISANTSWTIALDNLSHLPAWLSDALCRLSTGGGLAKRELYTDLDEVIFDAVRPIILTSIVELAERSDLLDRCLPVTLPPILEDQRRDEETLLAEFEAARPRIFGALLSAVAGALAELPTVKLDRLPRMADFAKWATAAEPALGWPRGKFMEAYKSNREAANELALEASTIASKLVELLASKGQWEGTAGELLAALEATFADGAKLPRDWPKNPRGLSAHLRRLAPNLQAAGCSIDFGRSTDRGRRRTLSIRSTAASGGAGVASEPSVSSDAPKTPADPQDASADGRGETSDGRAGRPSGNSSAQRPLLDGSDGSDANGGSCPADGRERIEI